MRVDVVQDGDGFEWEATVAITEHAGDGTVGRTRVDAAVQGGAFGGRTYAQRRGMRAGRRSSAAQSSMRPDKQPNRRPPPLRSTLTHRPAPSASNSTRPTSHRAVTSSPTDAVPALPKPSLKSTDSARSPAPFAHRSANLDLSQPCVPRLRFSRECPRVRRFTHSRPCLPRTTDTRLLTRTLSLLLLRLPSPISSNLALHPPAFLLV